jgi:ABC-2 type transport system ATP-binding protein
MDEAEQLCDRCGIMEKGNLIALDTPDNLIDTLIAKGFERKKQIKAATLEDVFIDLTGKEWMEG